MRRPGGRVAGAVPRDAAGRRRGRPRVRGRALGSARKLALRRAVARSSPAARAARPRCGRRRRSDRRPRPRCAGRRRAGRPGRVVGQGDRGCARGHGSGGRLRRPRVIDRAAGGLHAGRAAGRRPRIRVGAVPGRGAEERAPRRARRGGRAGGRRRARQAVVPRCRARRDGVPARVRHVPPAALPPRVGGGVGRGRGAASRRGRARERPRIRRRGRVALRAHRVPCRCAAHPRRSGRAADDTGDATGRASAPSPGSRSHSCSRPRAFGARVASGSSRPPSSPGSPAAWRASAGAASTGPTT